MTETFAETSDKLQFVALSGGRQTEVCRTFFHRVYNSLFLFGYKEIFDFAFYF